MKPMNTIGISGNRRARSAVHPWISLLSVVPLIAGCAVGQYRMPYDDGIVVFVAQDHETHSSPDASMYDLIAQNASPAAIVAAQAGVVRFIEDGNEEPTNDNNYVWIEHPQYSYPCDEEVCTEWTVYVHFEKDSVTGIAGLSVGDMVGAGDFLGWESNVGFTIPDAFVHQHFHVAALPPGVGPTFNGYYRDYVLDTGNQPELIPVICHPDGPDVMEQGESYTAAACSGASPVSGIRVRRVVERVRAQLQPSSPIALAIGQISEVSEEAVAIAQSDRDLQWRTLQLLLELKPAFEDLRHLGAARVTIGEVEMVRSLLEEYRSRGSSRLRAALEPLARMLANPAGTDALGLVVWDPLDVLD